MMNYKEQKGAGLLEVVIGVGIVTLTIVGLTNSYGLFIRSASAQGQFVKAQFLLEEGVEVVRTLRDEDWDNLANLSTGATYWLAFDPSSGWEATTTQIFIDDSFERTVVFDEVKRDGNDDITTVGTLDPGTLKLTVNVLWESRSGTTTQAIETYFANIFF